jgi:hypothetical protein
VAGSITPRLDVHVVMERRRQLCGVRKLAVPENEGLDARGRFYDGDGERGVFARAGLGSSGDVQ